MSRPPKASEVSRLSGSSTTPTISEALSTVDAKTKLCVVWCDAQAVQTPENGQPVYIFPVEKKIARFMGSIAETKPSDGQRVEAVMVVEDFKHKILDLYERWVAFVFLK